MSIYIVSETPWSGGFHVSVEAFSLLDEAIKCVEDTVSFDKKWVKQSVGHIWLYNQRPDIQIALHEIDVPGFGSWDVGRDPSSNWELGGSDIE